MDREKTRFFWMHGSKKDFKKELRWWWYCGRACFHLQLSRPKFHMGFGIDTDHEHHIHGDLMGIYWHLEWWALAKRLPRCSHSFKFYWYHGGLWFQLWGHDWESGRDDPWWRQTHHLDFADLILGKEHYSKRDTEVIDDVVIPMPERNYRARVTFTETTRKRARWFTTVSRWSEVSLDSDAPPFPGKGENSWDCGDDGIYGMSVKGHSLAKAIGGYVERVMEYREKRSGRRTLIHSGSMEKEQIG